MSPEGVPEAMEVFLHIGIGWWFNSQFEQQCVDALTVLLSVSATFPDLYAWEKSIACALINEVDESRCNQYIGTGTLRRLLDRLTFLGFPVSVSTSSLILI